MTNKTTIIDNFLDTITNNTLIKNTNHSKIEKNEIPEMSFFLSNYSAEYIEKYLRKQRAKIEAINIKDIVLREPRLSEYEQTAMLLEKARRALK